MSMRRFDKILVANRGEIAVRVIRGAQRLGYRTVAVYSEADRDAMHVRIADEAVCIGPPPAAGSYLSIEAIVNAARGSGAQAIHPGYGFLSERADFAAAVQDAGLVFIGPDAVSIQAMGNKSAAKSRMLAAKVPCIPGYEGDDQSDDILEAEAIKAGLPVMIKAAAGGGGRGMRLVSEQAELKANIRSARSEAENAFGSGQLLVEKAVVGGRHIEIQIFGDRHGNAVHLGERDCSIQRRNQKVVEEAPSPVVDEALRRKMGEAAVAAARAVDYVGAGTVEFMLDADCEHFYFLEMNTRLQVEHAITEAVYDVDLVEWQLRVAQGEALPLTQEEILARRHGHAIEVRLCTEDPAQDYLPQSGPVLRWQAPQGEGIRVDAWLTPTGSRITPHYDSMQAKIVSFGDTRGVARARMVHALEATELLGVRSNRDFAHAILCDEDYAAGNFDTGFIPAHFPQSALAEDEPTSVQWMLAAVVLMVDMAQALVQDAGINPELSGWSSVAATTTKLTLQWRDTEKTVAVTPANGRRFRLSCDDVTFDVEVRECGGGILRYCSNGREERTHYARKGDELWLDAGNRIEVFTDCTYAAAKAGAGVSDGRVLARSDGRIAAVHVKAGESVEKGQAVLVLEAMKMEFQVPAPIDGKISAVNVEAGTQVKARQLLVQVEAVEMETSPD